MKPFNLEEAKQGKSVCTREGKPARIICFDKNDKDYPIVALISYEDTSERAKYFTKEGKYNKNRAENHYLCLMMVGEKKEGWINIYRYGEQFLHSNTIHKTLEDAYKNRNVDGYITTIKIEWEE